MRGEAIVLLFFLFFLFFFKQIVSTLLDTFNECIQLLFNTKPKFELNGPRREKTRFFAYAKTKTQISFAVSGSAPLFSLHR